MPVIRQSRQMFTKPIGVQSFDTGADQIGRAVSNLANVMGQEFYERAAKKAEKSGQEAAQSVAAEDLKVFNPETGKPEVMSSTDGMGSIARESFERVIDRRFVDTVDKDIRLKSAELASKYENPNQYESMFTSYLNSLAEGADDRYKNIIMDSGSYTMGSTKIQLADNARRKYRAAAQQSLQNTNQSFRESIYDAAASGETDTAAALIQERANASKEGVDAGLFKSGYDAKVTSDLAVQALSGVLQSQLQDATPLQQSAINLYIGSQGLAGGESLTATQKSEIDKFIGYVDRTNTGAILNQSNAIAGDVNAVRAARAAEQQAIFQAEANQFRMNYEADSIFPTRANAARANANAWSLGEQHFVMGAVNATNTAYETERVRLQQARAAKAIGQEEYDSFLQDQRRAGLDSIVLNMATDGNIEALKVAFTTQNPTDIAQLSPLQQSAFVALQQTTLYNPADDRNYVSTLLSGSQNEVQSKIDREIRNANLSLDVSNVSSDFMNGTFSQESIEAAEARAQSALRDGDISSSEYKTLSGGLRNAAGKGIVNIAADSMSPFEMNALANYVSSGGQETAGVNGFVQTVGDSILGVVPESQRSSVVNHANSIREKLEKKESMAQAEVAKRQLRATVLSGGGSANEKTHREESQRILEAAGVDIRSPDSKNDAVYSLMRSAPPQSLVDGLKSVTLGLEVDGADVFLDHFAVMSNDPTSSGVMVNRFGVGDGAALSAAQTAILQDIASIRKITGQPTNVIATTLIERRNDPKSAIYLKSVFGEKVSPKEYVSDRYGSIIGEDVADAAEYFALTGLPKSDINDRLDALVDSRFIKSRVVVDPRFPVGANNRSMFALESQFPDEDRRDEFVRVINSQLPDGYELARYENKLSASWRAVTSGMKVPQKVYLVPNENTAGASYYAHVVDENNELRPLFMEIDGELGIPLFDKDDLKEYDAMKAIERAAEIEANLDQAEKVRDATDARPGLRSLSDISTLSLGR